MRPPDLKRSRPRRKTAAKHVAVDEPVRLRVAADDGGRKKLRHGPGLASRPPSGALSAPPPRARGGERSGHWPDLLAHHFVLA
jgi:hypothetical protein